jgi:hypothetical protein
MKEENFREHNYSGACCCGAVEVEDSGQPEAMGYCHCQSCRSWAASPVNAFTLWKPENVKVTKGADQTGAYHKTEKNHRQFCRTCGGHVMSRLPAFGLIDVFSAAIPDFPFRPQLRIATPDVAADARRASEIEGLSPPKQAVRRNHCRIERLCCMAGRRSDSISETVAAGRAKQTLSNRTKVRFDQKTSPRLGNVLPSRLSNARHHAASLLRRFEGYLGRREYAYAGRPHFDMTLVELRETRAVPNRNDRRAGKFSGKDFVDFGFHRFVHRRRGFVEEEPIGLGQYRASNRKALLLAAGKPLRPIILGIELADELAELRVTQRLAVAMLP